MKRMFVLLCTAFVFFIADTAYPEEWIEIYSETMSFTYKGKIFKQYSEIYMDKDSIKINEYGSKKIWIKNIAYNNPQYVAIGQPEQEITKQLWIINCKTMTFDTLVGGTDDAYIDSLVSTYIGKNVVSGSMLKYNIQPDSVPAKLATILCK